MRLKKYFVNL